MAVPVRRTNYRLGSLYALTTAGLLATQEPFSAVAAKRLDAAAFICFTQLALLLSVPLLILPRGSRRDFVALLADPRNLGRLATLFAVGLCGLLLYHVGLSSAHPIIAAAIFNLSPFWAALVARLISGKAVPVSPRAFFGCFGVAFVGAMLVAWSQIGKSGDPMIGDLVHSLLHSRWAFAIPIPIFYALSGTLVGRWFAEYDESAAIAANFLFSAVVLIPSTLLLAQLRPAFSMDIRETTAILLLLFGTLAAAAAGRVFYQVALTATDNDNGFVTMFFLLVPVLSALITAPLSLWIVDLRFVGGPLFVAGMALITAPLLLFSLLSHRTTPA